jgi:hypothetical protein
MVNVSSSARLITAGAGATFLALLASPLGHADTGGADADISTIYADAVTFANSFGSFEDALFFSDLTSSANLFSASGIDFGGDPFPSGATGTSDVGAIAAEGSKLANELNVLEYFNPTGVQVGTDSKELPLIAETLTFQDQINQSVAFLPSIPAQDETNPLVIADLSGLYNNELNLDTTLTNLGEALTGASPAELTADNATIIADALGIANDAQGASETLTLLAELTSFGL